MACVGAKQLTQVYLSQLTLIVTDKTTDLSWMDNQSSGQLCDIICLNFIYFYFKLQK